MTFSYDFIAKDNRGNIQCMGLSIDLKNIVDIIITSFPDFSKISKQLESLIEEIGVSILSAYIKFNFNNYLVNYKTLINNAFSMIDELRIENKLSYSNIVNQVIAGADVFVDVRDMFGRFTITCFIISMVFKIELERIIDVFINELIIPAIAEINFDIYYYGEKINLDLSIGEQILYSFVEEFSSILRNINDVKEVFKIAFNPETYKLLVYPKKIIKDDSVETRAALTAVATSIAAWLASFIVGVVVGLIVGIITYLIFFIITEIVLWCLELAGLPEYALYGRIIVTIISIVVSVVLLFVQNFDLEGASKGGLLAMGLVWLFLSVIQLIYQGVMCYRIWKTYLIPDEVDSTDIEIVNDRDQDGIEERLDVNDNHNLIWHINFKDFSSTSNMDGLKYFNPLQYNVRHGDPYGRYTFINGNQGIGNEFYPENVIPEIWSSVHMNTDLYININELRFFDISPGVNGDLSIYIMMWDEDLGRLRDSYNAIDQQYDINPSEYYLYQVITLDKYEIGQLTADNIHFFSYSFHYYGDNENSGTLTGSTSIVDREELFYIDDTEIIYPIK